MNSETTTGLVLRIWPLTETSLIVHWLTPDLGRLATVAKGARRPKSPFRGQLDLCYVAELSFARSSRSDLHTLREARLLEAHAGLRRDMDCLEQAAYCAKLVEMATESETPLPGLFERFCEMLAVLSQGVARPLTVFSFEIKLLNDLGLCPDFAETALSPGARRILEQALALDWRPLQLLQPDPRQTDELRRFLHGFIIYHLERIPTGRSRAIQSGPGE